MAGSAWFEGGRAATISSGARRWIPKRDDGAEDRILPPDHAPVRRCSAMPPSPAKQALMRAPGRAAYPVDGIAAVHLAKMEPTPCASDL